MRRRILLGAAGVGGVAGLASLAGWLDEDPEPVDTYVDAGAWLSTYHDTHNTNHNPEASPPTSEPSIAFERPGQFSEGSWPHGYIPEPNPITVAGRVVTGGDELTAYDSETGTERWRTPVEGTVVGLASDTHRIFTTERIGRQDTFVAAYDVMQGDRYWRVAYAPPVVAPPTVAGDELLVGGSAFLGSLSLDGEIRWERSPHIGTEVSPPAVTKDAVYAVSKSDDGRRSRTGVGKFSRSRGPLNTVLDDPPGLSWVTDMPLWLEGSPVLGDETVVAGTMRLMNHDEGTMPLLAYDTAGEERWRLDGGTLWATPAYADRTVYALNCTVTERTSESGGYSTYRRDATLYALDVRRGGEQWSRTFADFGSFHVAPVVAGGTVFLALHDDDGSRSVVVALDAGSGRERWRFELSSPAYHLATVSQLLYASLTDGTFLALS